MFSETDIQSMSVDTTEWFTASWNCTCTIKDCKLSIVSQKAVSKKCSQLCVHDMQNCAHEVLLQFKLISSHYIYFAHFQETSSFSGDSIIYRRQWLTVLLWITFYSYQNVQDQMCMITNFHADRWILWTTTENKFRFSGDRGIFRRHF